MSEPSQRYGVFLNVEDPDGNAGDALDQMVRTAVAAEALGFDDVWVTEHHYSRFAIGSFLLGVACFLLALLCFLAETVVATRLLNFHMLR